MRSQSALAAAFLLAITLALGANPPAQATPLLNGNFSSGLADYNYTAGDVTVANNQATLLEDPNGNEVDLSQLFTIPTGAKTLSFQLNGYTTDTTITYPLPDGFGASLLDATQSSLVPTVPNSDSYFTQDLFAGAAPLFATGVTLTPSNGSTPLTVTVDVSGLGGQDATILFRLIGGGDNTTDTVTISNLTLGPNINATPEPSSLLLASGILGLTFCYLKRYKRLPTSIAPEKASC